MLDLTTRGRARPVDTTETEQPVDAWDDRVHASLARAGSLRAGDVQVVLALAAGGEPIEGLGELGVLREPFGELGGELLLGSGWHFGAGSLDGDRLREQQRTPTPGSPPATARRPRGTHRRRGSLPWLDAPFRTMRAARGACRAGRCSSISPFRGQPRLRARADPGTLLLTGPSPVRCDTDRRPGCRVGALWRRRHRSAVPPPGVSMPRS
jgi:hypothetical protein